jgi:hypothetical protein
MFSTLQQWRRIVPVDIGWLLIFSLSDGLTHKLVDHCTSSFQSLSWLFNLQIHVDFLFRLAAHESSPYLLLLETSVGWAWCRLT